MRTTASYLAFTSQGKRQRVSCGAFMRPSNGQSASCGAFMRPGKGQRASYGAFMRLGNRLINSLNTPKSILWLRESSCPLPRKKERKRKGKSVEISRAINFDLSYQKVTCKTLLLTKPRCANQHVATTKEDSLTKQFKEGLLYIRRYSIMLKFLRKASPYMKKNAVRGMPLKPHRYHWTEFVHI